MSVSVYKRALTAALRPPTRQAHEDEPATPDHKQPPPPPPPEGAAVVEESALSLRLLADHFECPICSENMAGGGRKILSCSNDHWICDACIADDRIKRCPFCRECFVARGPKRCLTAERIARQITGERGAPRPRPPNASLSPLRSD